jgi:hypothetical protein
MVARIASSHWGSKPGEGDIFRIKSDEPFGLPLLLFTEGVAIEAWH